MGSDWGAARAGRDDGGMWEAILENGRLCVRYGFKMKGDYCGEGS